MAPSLGKRLHAWFSRNLFEFGSSLYAWMTWQPVWRSHCAEMADYFPAPRPRLAPGPRPERPGGAGEGLRVLDMGIGPGISGIGLLDRRPDLWIVGADFSAAMLRYAKHYLGVAAVHIPLCRADVTNLPFCDAAFDVVTHHSFLYLLTDQDASLREMARVLKPGGSYVIFEPQRNGDSRLQRLFRDLRVVFRLKGPGRFRLSMFLWRFFSSGYGQFRKDELLALLSRYGFVDVQVDETLQGLGLMVRARRALPPALAAPAEAS